MKDMTLVGSMMAEGVAIANLQDQPWLRWRVETPRTLVVEVCYPMPGGVTPPPHVIHHLSTDKYKVLHLYQ